MPMPYLKLVACLYHNYHNTGTAVRRLGPVMIVTANKYKHELISALARKYLENIDKNNSIGEQIATR